MTNLFSPKLVTLLFSLIVSSFIFFGCEPSTTETGNTRNFDKIQIIFYKNQNQDGGSVHNVVYQAGPKGNGMLIDRSIDFSVFQKIGSIAMTNLNSGRKDVHTSLQYRFIYSDGSTNPPTTIFNGNVNGGVDPGTYYFRNFTGTKLVKRIVCHVIYGWNPGYPAN